MKTKLPILLFVVTAVAFGLGLFSLFKTRYEVGDIYPQYSSLRSDPLGTMAFYESLSSLPEVHAERDFSSENVLPAPRGATYLHLAASAYDWVSMDEHLMRELEQFVFGGGRLVIAFSPEGSFTSIVRGPPPAGAAPKAKTNSKAGARRGAPAEKWGFEVRDMPLTRDANQKRQNVEARNKSDLELAPRISWHSSAVFTNLAPQWNVIFARGTHPVIVERKLGAGSVVMATDCYFLSNEAILKEPHPDLLAWLVGPSSQVYFDEAHLGIVNTPGVAALMRKYRLHGLMASLLVLAGLFIWRNVGSLAPPLVSPAVSSAVAGKDAATGLVNLLRRNVPRSELLTVCFEEWSKSLMSDGSHSIARVDQAQAVFERENARAKANRDPVRAYQEISAALTRRVRRNQR